MGLIVLGLVLSNGNGNGNGGGNGDLLSQNAILKIDNLAVNKKANTNYGSIEVGDEIRGELPAGSGRHIVADVIALPYTSDANLEIFSINEK